MLKNEPPPPPDRDPRRPDPTEAAAAGGTTPAPEVPRAAPLLLPPQQPPTPEQSTSELPIPTIAELDRDFWEIMSRIRAEQIAGARVLRRLAERGAFPSLGCASVGEYGERCAVSADEARMLLEFGKALKAEPRTEAFVREGQLPVAAAAVVGEALTTPGLSREGDEWLGWALNESTRRLRRRLRQRKEELRGGNPVVVPIHVLVPVAVRDDLEQARIVASRRADRVLSSAETLGVVVKHYLDSFDPRRVEPGTRRSGSTEGVPGRQVPVEVRREIFARQCQRCAVPFCDNEIFLELAHVVPHAHRGSREASNLILLCGQHHTAFDEGLIELQGSVEAPEFVDLHDRSLTQRFGAESRSGKPVEPGRVGPRSVVPRRAVPRRLGRGGTREGGSGGGQDPVEPGAVDGAAGPAPPAAEAG